MFIVEGISLGMSEQDRKIESQQVELWNGNLAVAKGKPTFERLELLERGLINMGHRKRGESRDKSVDRVYGEIQTEILSIPGYAQYFADEIESERQKIPMLRKRDGTWRRYDRRRFEILRLILVELPGPESVAMLGHYLHDERDPEPPSSPSQDWDSPKPSSEIASEALAHIGLRNHPVTKKDFMHVDAIVRNRAWWEEVKSGKRTFSFIGQNVEYRFKPDGTWETLPMVDPPDDAPGRREAGAVDRPLKRPQPSTFSEEKIPQAKSWNWAVAGALISVLVGIFWFSIRRRLRSSVRP